MTYITGAGNGWGIKYLIISKFIHLLYIWIEKNYNLYCFYKYIFVFNMYKLSFQIYFAFIVFHYKLFISIPKIQKYKNYMVPYSSLYIFYPIIKTR